MVNNLIKLNILDKAKIRIANLYTLIGLILYRISLDYAYNNIVSYLFEYQNFRNVPTCYSIILSWLFLLSLAPLIIKTFNQATLSSSILSVLLLVSLIPITTMIAFNSYYPIKYVILMYIYWLLILVLNIKIRSIIFSKRKRILLPNFHWYLTAILCLSVIFISWKYTGFRFHFGLYDVYDLRTEAREYNVPFILGYLGTFSDNLLPVLLVYYLDKKHKVLSSILIIIILLNFGITGSKQILFLLFFSLIGYYFVKSFKVLKKMIWFFFLLILLCIAEFNIFSTYSITTFSIYRVFFIPAKLHYVYYEFFLTRELDYFRQSIFKWFLESPYKENIGFIIGDYEIGDFTARANNGLFTDAYLNFGTIGILLFPIILVLILKILEASVKGLHERILFIVIISTSFVLLSLPFTTALFSAGVIVLIIFFYFLPREYVSKKNKQR